MLQECNYHAREVSTYQLSTTPKGVYKPVYGKALQCELVVLRESSITSDEDAIHRYIDTLCSTHVHIMGLDTLSNIMTVNGHVDSNFQYIQHCSIPPKPQATVETTLIHRHLSTFCALYCTLLFSLFSLPVGGINSFLRIFAEMTQNSALKIKIKII